MNINLTNAESIGLVQPEKPDAILPVVVRGLLPDILARLKIHRIQIHSIQLKFNHSTKPTLAADKQALFQHLIRILALRLNGQPDTYHQLNP